MTKLKASLFLLSGFALGFAASGARDWLHGAMIATYDAADSSVALTYAYAEQDTLRKESNVLRRMAEPHWLGLPSGNARKQLTDLGLFDFEKGSEGFAAGPVFLRLQDGVVVEIQAHCSRLKSEDCKNEGGN